jgi:hypothetical protein
MAGDAEALRRDKAECGKDPQERTSWLSSICSSFHFRVQATTCEVTMSLNIQNSSTPSHWSNRNLSLDKHRAETTWLGFSLFPLAFSLFPHCNQGDLGEIMAGSVQKCCWNFLEVHF